MRTAVDAPRTEGDLLARARRLAGLTVGELALRCDETVPAEPRRGKGFVGRLVERALGGAGTNEDVADFPALGVELKTIPVRRDGRPRESTFVCTLDLRTLADGDWAAARVRRKLARVLWVPVESAPAVPIARRRIGTPALWSPTPEEEEALRTDWEEIALLVGRGDVEFLDARAGRWLQVRPKAANARSRGRALDASGAPVRTLPRGFYLRATFTARILRDALAIGNAARSSTDAGDAARGTADSTSAPRPATPPPVAAGAVPGR